MRNTDLLHDVVTGGEMEREWEIKEGRGIPEDKRKAVWAMFEKRLQKWLITRTHGVPRYDAYGLVPFKSVKVIPMMNEYDKRYYKVIFHQGDKYPVLLLSNIAGLNGLMERLKSDFRNFGRTEKLRWEGRMKLSEFIKKLRPFWKVLPVMSVDLESIYKASRKVYTSNTFVGTNNIVNILERCGTESSIVKMAKTVGGKIYVLISSPTETYQLTMPIFEAKTISMFFDLLRSNLVDIESVDIKIEEDENEEN